MFLYNKRYLKITVFAWLMFYIFFNFQVNVNVSKKVENKIKRLAFCLFMHCLTQQLATSRYEKKVPSHVMKSLSKSR
jgi:hypothetical protein